MKIQKMSWAKYMAVGVICLAGMGLTGCGQKSAPSPEEIQAFNPDPSKMTEEQKALMQKNEAAIRQKQAAGVKPQ